MVKRVSVKGMGADIFFGDSLPQQPAEPPSPTPDEQAASSEAAPESLGGQGAKEESMQESKHARKRASKKEDKKEETQEASSNQMPASPLASEVIASVWPNLSERATITNAFRYTATELSSLTDAIYEITKRQGAKLSKQDIARLGLNAVLWDFQARGENSLLGEFVKKRKLQTQG
jgi:hypothetical protein